MKECTETKAFFGKDFHPDLPTLRMRPKEAKKGKETQESKSPLAFTNSYWVPGIHHKADDQLLLFLTKSKSGLA